MSGGTVRSPRRGRTLWVVGLAVALVVAGVIGVLVTLVLAGGLGLLLRHRGRSAASAED